MVTKGYNFCDFLFACLNDVDFPNWGLLLNLLHTEWPKIPIVLAILSAIGLKERIGF